MKQGVLVNKRVRLLLGKGASCYRPRKQGERKRRSVRGCFVGPDIAVLNLVVMTVGDKDLDGVTRDEDAKPRRLGPKYRWGLLVHRLKRLSSEIQCQQNDGSTDTGANLATRRSPSPRARRPLCRADDLARGHQRDKVHALLVRQLVCQHHRDI